MIDMHAHTLKNWQHDHEFSIKNLQGERRTQYVLILTFVTMIVEIIAGGVYGSMALLADGWHMSTHVAAFAIAIFTYRYARTHANDPAYAFGTGKVNVLGGFASAVALAVVALVMLIESLQRLFEPRSILFDEAIVIAAIGLSVNLLSAFLLKQDHRHAHHRDDGHHHDDDHNLRAAYLHVLADAMTSVLAIAALLLGKYLGWEWLDPVMGIVGAFIIAYWSYGLMKQTGPILLDASIEKGRKQEIKATIEEDSDNRVSDIHVWKVGTEYAAIIALVTHHPRSTEHYKNLLNRFHELSHVTIEVNECKGEPCMVPKTN